MNKALKKTINKQREILVDLLTEPLTKLALILSPDMQYPEKLEQHLHDAFPLFQHCKYLYVMNQQMLQILSANI